MQALAFFFKSGPDAAGERFAVFIAAFWEKYV